MPSGGFVVAWAQDHAVVAHLLAASLLFTPGVQLADDVEVRRVRLIDARPLVVARPALLAPVTMIVGGGALLVGGTALSLVGIFLSGLKVGCATERRCDGINVTGNVMLVSGLVVILAGVITAIVGHVKVSERIEERDPREVDVN